MTFEKWFDELTSNHVWYEPARLHHKPETFRSIANKVYMDFLAGNGVKSIEDCRRHVYNLVCKTPGDNKKVDWVGKALEKMAVEKEEEWKPADPAHVDKCVKEFFDMLNNSPMVKYKPSKEVIFYNGKPKEKLPPYPITSLEEAYIRDRHFEYIKYAYEPKTGDKRPNVLTEEEFNQQYDLDKFKEI